MKTDKIKGKVAIKAKVKAKAEATKEKLKGGRSAYVASRITIAGALLGAALLAGCMDTNPASRLNSNSFGDIEPKVKVVIGEGACSNVVNVTLPVTLGDGVLASADSSGSTETQTATPTQTTDVKPDIDATIPATAIP